MEAEDSYHECTYYHLENHQETAPPQKELLQVNAILRKKILTRES